MTELIQYLRQQAYAANLIADALEAGESIEDLKWMSDLNVEWEMEIARIHGQLELNHELREAIEREAS